MAVAYLEVFPGESEEALRVKYREVLLKELPLEYRASPEELPMEYRAAFREALPMEYRAAFRAALPMEYRAAFREALPMEYRAASREEWPMEYRLRNLLCRQRLLPFIECSQPIPPRQGPAECPARSLLK